MYYEINKSDLCSKRINNREFILLNNVTRRWVILNKSELQILEKFSKNNQISSNSGEFLQKLYFQGICKRDGSYKFKFENSILKVTRPFYLVLKITGKCNFKCDYCYANKLEQKIMSKGVYKKIIHEFINLNNKENCIVFHGGEPFVCFKLIKEIYSYAKKIKKPNQSIIFKVQTNGSILNKEIVSFLKKKDVSLGISVDLLNRNKYRKYSTGSKTFAQVYENMGELRKEKIRFSVISVLTSNYKYIGHLMKLLTHFRIREFKLNPIFGEHYSNKKAIHLTNDKYFNILKKVIGDLIKYNKEHKEKIYESNVSYLVKNIILGNYCYMCLSSPCGAGRCVISCSPSGDIYPCDELYFLPRFKMGNILENSLKNILLFKGINSLKMRNVERISNCRNCAFKFFCCGGCPSKVLSFYGKLDAKNPFCIYNQRMTLFILRLINEKGISPNLLSNI